MPIPDEIWRDDHPFSSLHKVERRIRQFLADNPTNGYTVREIYDAVVPREWNDPPICTTEPEMEDILKPDYEPILYILTQMYCAQQVNTIRLDRGILLYGNQLGHGNVRLFRHRPGTKQIFMEPTPADAMYQDATSETERRSGYDVIE